MPKYWIRFDDICPTMNWNTWEIIEDILLKYDVKPMIAVVPNNKDPYLIVDKENNKFWMKVRFWQEKGWLIGIHGYEHKPVGRTKSNFFPIKSVTEFVGLSYEKQLEKIDKSLNIFKKEKINSKLWISPGHTFDDITLRILKEKGIEMISDSFFPKIGRYQGFIWIPIHFWRVRKMPFGTWGICLHHNEFGEKDLKKFENFISENRKNLIDLKEFINKRRIPKINTLDLLYNKAYSSIYLMKNKGVKK